MIDNHKERFKTVIIFVRFNTISINLFDKSYHHFKYKFHCKKYNKNSINAPLLHAL